MKDILLAGLAMMLVFEGLLPLLAPRAWRAVVMQLADYRDGQLRFVGLVSVIAGLSALALLN